MRQLPKSLLGKHIIKTTENKSCGAMILVCFGVGFYGTKKQRRAIRGKVETFESVIASKSQLVQQAGKYWLMEQ